MIILQAEFYEAFIMFVTTSISWIESSLRFFDEAAMLTTRSVIKGSMGGRGLDWTHICNLKWT